MKGPGKVMQSCKIGKTGVENVVLRLTASRLVLRQHRDIIISCRRAYAIRTSASIHDKLY